MIRLKFKLIKKIFYITVISITCFFLVKSFKNFSIKTNFDYQSHVSDLFYKLNQPDLIASSNNSNGNQILIIGTSRKSDQVSEFIRIAQWSRFKTVFISLKSDFDRKIVYKHLKRYKSFYSVIVFESLEHTKSIVNQQLIDYLIDSALRFRIGLIFLDNKLNSKIEYCKLNPNSVDFYKTTKFNLEANFFIKLLSKTNEYTALEAEKIPGTIPVLLCDSEKNAILKNNGTGLRYIVMNIRLQNILSSLILDIIEYSSYDLLSLGLERLIQIDIDDIFVGTPGIRLKRQDVYALVDFQTYLNNNYFNSSVEKFKFNLGFSGFHYCSGNHDENLGDQLLIEQKNNFNWFDHTWSHFKSQHLNSSQLKEQFYYNFLFAQEHDLPTDTFYSVSPHHSGIYPASNNLFELWSKIWMVKVTSTEEYPHLRPSNMRRGFMFRNIMVLPRQTCGIFTHTNFFNGFPKGIESLLLKIYGGEIFQTILFNRVNIFMTHMTNYGNDRVGLFVFKNLFKFLKTKTNLKFVYKPPLELGIDYFNFHPDEIEPIWTNPCIDAHHMAIWSLNQTCHRFPKLIILGPQKTGTTALHHFLNAHPLFSSNRNTHNHFEETQFFSTEYFNGLDWYLSLFDSGSFQINFEKSANYFSDPKAPYRIRKLLPNIKLIIILTDPIDRAYSWYHHMKAHKEPIALKYTFYEILTYSSGNKSYSKTVERLKKKCLNSGIYIKHLIKWLRLFRRNQLLIVDGDEFKQRPYMVMNSIQLFMNSTKFVNYENLLVYDKRKKFFCLKKSPIGTQRCLGPSKGRIYDKIDKKSYFYLKYFYKKSNMQLLNFFTKNSLRIPSWLKKYTSIKDLFVN